MERPRFNLIDGGIGYTVRITNSILFMAMAMDSTVRFMDGESHFFEGKILAIEFDDETSEGIKYNLKMWDDTETNIYDIKVLSYGRV